MYSSSTAPTVASALASLSSFNLSSILLSDAVTRHAAFSTFSVQRIGFSYGSNFRISTQLKISVTHNSGITINSVSLSPGLLYQMTINTPFQSKPYSTSLLQGTTTLSSTPFFYTLSSSGLNQSTVTLLPVGKSTLQAFRCTRGAIMQSAGVPASTVTVAQVLSALPGQIASSLLAITNPSFNSATINSRLTSLVVEDAVAVYSLGRLSSLTVRVFDKTSISMGAITLSSYLLTLKLTNLVGSTSVSALVDGYTSDLVSIQLPWNTPDTSLTINVPDIPVVAGRRLFSALNDPARYVPDMLFSVWNVPDHELLDLLSPVSSKATLAGKL